MVIDSSIFYPDTCVISRFDGSINASTGDEIPTSVYSGICGFNLNHTGDTALNGLEYISAPKIIIPTYDVLFKVNDTVIVTCWSGRIIKGTLKNYDPCNYPGMTGATIWLKQGQDE